MRTGSPNVGIPTSESKFGPDATVLLPSELLANGPSRSIVSEVLLLVGESTVSTRCSFSCTGLSCSLLSEMNPLSCLSEVADAGDQFGERGPARLHSPTRLLASISRVLICSLRLATTDDALSALPSRCRRATSRSLTALTAASPVDRARTWVRCFGESVGEGAQSPR